MVVVAFVLVIDRKRLAWVLELNNFPVCLIFLYRKEYFAIIYYAIEYVMEQESHLTIGFVNFSGFQNDVRDAI